MMVKRGGKKQKGRPRRCVADAMDIYGCADHLINHVCYRTLEYSRRSALKGHRRTNASPPKNEMEKKHKEGIGKEAASTKEVIGRGIGYAM